MGIHTVLWFRYLYALKEATGPWVPFINPATVTNKLTTSQTNNGDG